MQPSRLTDKPYVSSGRSAKGEFEAGNGARARRTLLVIDDQRTILATIKKVAEEVGYLVEATQDPHRFKELVRTFAPDLILIDVVMPEEDGLELLRFLAEQKVTTPVIVMSEYGAQLLNCVWKLGSALGLSLRAVQKPLGPSQWQSLLAESNSDREGLTP